MGLGEGYLVGPGQALPIWRSDLGPWLGHVDTSQPHRVAAVVIVAR
jgi:hypothetical protein